MTDLSRSRVRGGAVASVPFCVEARRAATGVPVWSASFGCSTTVRVFSVFRVGLSRSSSTSSATFSFR